MVALASGFTASFQPGIPLYLTTVPGVDILRCGSYLIELDAGTATNSFILGNATKGLLGGATYLVGGSPGWKDVSAYVQVGNISRGRRNPFQQESGEPSICTLILQNNSFWFSVLNTSSPYWNTSTNRLGFERGVGIRISRENEYLFVGVITDLKQDVEIRNFSTVTISASDKLFQLNNVKVPDQTVIVERSDQRIEKLLTSVGAFSGIRDLAVGAANLGLAPVDVGASMLDQINRVNNSERGRIFVSRTGRLTMHKRVDRELTATVATLTDVVTDSNVRFMSFEIANN